MSKLFSNIRHVIFASNSLNSYQQVRWLPRWQHRRPVGVIEAENYDEITDSRKKHTEEIQETTRETHSQNLNLQQRRSVERIKVRDYDEITDSKKKNKGGNSLTESFHKVSWKQPRKDKKPVGTPEIGETTPDFRVSHKYKPLTISKSNESEKVKRTFVDMLETVIDDEGNIVYTKMKNNDTRVVSILTDIKSRKEKEKNDLALLEGKRLIKDALDAGCHLKYIIFSRTKDLEYFKSSLPKYGVTMYKMPYTEMQLWSGLTTNPGIMGVLKIPDTETFNYLPDSLPITVICDNLREPGNLGAVLRTCGGVGCQEVILTKGCVNVWDSKVLRSASGAHFRVKIKRKLDFQAIKDNLPPASQVFIADNNMLSSSSGTDEKTLANIVQSIPLLPYYGVDFTSLKHIVLIIGGETEGISEESYKLASDFNGLRLNVPLNNNIDSLNTGTALGVIAFEIKRQLLKN